MKQTSNAFFISDNVRNSCDQFHWANLHAKVLYQKQMQRKDLENYYNFIKSGKLLFQKSYEVMGGEMTQKLIHHAVADNCVNFT